MFSSPYIQSKINAVLNNLAITKRQHFQQGFTIIELMVTVAIIAILSGISITGYQYFRDRAEYSTLRLEAERLRQQVDICFNLGRRGTECQSAADADAYTNNPLSAPPAVTAATNIIGLNVAWGAATATYTITAKEPTNSTLAGNTTSTYVLVGTVTNLTGNINWVSTCTPGNLC